MFNNPIITDELLCWKAFPCWYISFLTLYKIKEWIVNDSLIAKSDLLTHSYNNSWYSWFEAGFCLFFHMHGSLTCKWLTFICGLQIEYSSLPIFGIYTLCMYVGTPCLQEWKQKHVYSENCPANWYFDLMLLEMHWFQNSWPIRILKEVWPAKFKFFRSRFSI